MQKNLSHMGIIYSMAGPYCSKYDVTSHVFPYLAYSLHDSLFILFQNNTNVINLEIQDNWLEGEGGEYIAEMLNENCYIASLVSSVACYF